MIEFRKTVLALFLPLAVVGFSGCEKNDAASYVAAAQGYLAKSDFKSAVIEAKNALQKDSDNVDARLALATALLEGGDAPGAEVEIRKVLASSRATDRAYPLLGRALLAQGQNAKVTQELAETKVTDPAARADLAASLAAAYLGQGDVAKANAANATALAEQPENPRALLLKAQIAFAGRDFKSAIDTLNVALEKSPDDLRLLLAKAEMEVQEGKKDEAAKLLDHAIEAHPDSLPARSTRLSLALKSGNLEVAKEQLARMKEKHPRDYTTVYSDALVAFASADYSRARDSVQKVLAGNPDNLPSLLLSGLVNYQLGSYAASEDALQKVVERAPSEMTARRALALLYLRTGRGSRALASIEPALAKAPDDPSLLRVAGEAYLASGNIAMATSAYERANTNDKNNVGSEVRLAQVRLAAGEADRAFSDLESLSSQDEKANAADLALFTAHLRRREYDQALAAADAIEKKQPKSGVAPNLRGVVYLAERDLKRARASFEQALQLQPGMVAAASNLATVDIQEGHPQSALDRYTKLLAKDASNEQWLLAHAELLSMTGAAPSAVKADIEKAIAAHPTSAAPRLALVAFHERQSDPKAGVAAALSASSAMPNEPRIVESLGAAYLANADTNQAVDTFKRLVQLVPQNALAFLRLADAQLLVKDYDGAIASAKKALAIKPDLPQAWVTIAKAYLVSGRPTLALEEAQNLRKQKSDKAIGDALEGEILLAQNKAAEAAASFARGLAKQPVAYVATREHTALNAANKSSEADAFAQKWMRAHPNDFIMPLYLAEIAQKRGDLGAAKSGYQRVLELDADNVVALNNLAWILAEAKDPKAVEFAERAQLRAPTNPGILDTLGWAFVRTGDAKRGIQLLQMASGLAPTRPEIRLHLAKALAESGDKARARKELDTLTKLDKASPVRVEAEKLLTTL